MLIRTGLFFLMAGLGVMIHTCLSEPHAKQDDREQALKPHETRSLARRSRPSEPPGKKRPTYKSLYEEERAEREKIPKPKVLEMAMEMEMEDELRHRFKEKAKDLLFSIPVSPEVAADRDLAWEQLDTNGGESPRYEAREARDRFALELLQKHANAPQLEILVLWETIRSRRVLPSRGSRSGEILFEIEVAKVVFPAMGLNMTELLEAADIRVMKNSDEAWKKGSDAMDEIERSYREQGWRARKILERHWRVP